MPAVITCPGCRQKLRAPIGLGTLLVTCPRCGQRREWDSAGPQRKRRVVVGLAGLTGLLLLGSYLAWQRWQPKAQQPPQAAASDRAERGDPGPQPQPAPTPVEDKPIPVEVSRPRPGLQELFVRLSPSVPVVQSVYQDGDFLWAHGGSGLLLKHGDKLLVATNRHVIENSPKGVFVHFPMGRDKRFTVPSRDTRVVAVHRSADLALVDVTPARADIERFKVEPVTLVTTDHRPKVGERVFAIGHPGGGRRRSADQHPE